MRRRRRGVGRVGGACVSCGGAGRDVRPRQIGGEAYAKARGGARSPSAASPPEATAAGGVEMGGPRAGLCRSLPGPGPGAGAAPRRLASECGREGAVRAPSARLRQAVVLFPRAGRSAAPARAVAKCARPGGPPRPGLRRAPLSRRTGPPVAVLLYAGLARGCPLTRWRSTKGP